MEILYSAVEEKQAELEESLTTIQHRQEQLKHDFSPCLEEKGHNLTQNDPLCIQLEELSLQEKAINNELQVLSHISALDGTFEDIRLAARNAHTCLMNESDFGSSLYSEEEKLNELSNKAAINYQELVLEYRRLRKSPPNMSQEDLLRLFMDYEQRITTEKVKRDIFALIAERLLYEHNRSKTEEFSYSEHDGLSL